MFIALLLTPSKVFSWGPATHAHIDDMINSRSGLKNINEIYGGMAPDIFNFMLSCSASSSCTAYKDYLSHETHYNFSKVWNKAKLKPEKALAYGFVSHNEVWGADFTAHCKGRTTGVDKGYVVYKSLQLQEKLSETWIVLNLDGEDFYDLRIEFCHYLVEAGVDILMKRLDPSIGQKIIYSTTCRDPGFPRLLVRAYAEGLSEYAGISYLKAAENITSAEKEFKNMMILYGQSLVLNEEAAIESVSEKLVELAENYPLPYEITLPGEVDLTPLVESAVRQAIDMCADDFSDEILATTDFVNQQLISHETLY